ncbi:hypothetical protein BDF14DRAFT_1740698 [Spinellus fusiger]|nr:hypothetical protein BDF14DRAFT_1740698 [Spinellus fusiger]
MSDNLNSTLLNSQKLADAFFVIAEEIKKVAVFLSTNSSKSYDEDEKEGKKKRKKSTRDSNAPKRNVHSFVHYVIQNRIKLKADVPELDSKEYYRVLGENWNKMSDVEKKPYKDQADKDKERYQKEIEAYKQHLIDMGQELPDELRVSKKAKKAIKKEDLSDEPTLEESSKSKKVVAKKPETVKEAKVEPKKAKKAKKATATEAPIVKIEPGAQEEEEALRTSDDTTDNESEDEPLPIVKSAVDSTPEVTPAVAKGKETRKLSNAKSVSKGKAAVRKQPKSKPEVAISKPESAASKKKAGK